MNNIYLDNAGTTPMDPAVIKTMTEMMNDVFGNASATNSFGRKAHSILEQSRQKIAASINAQDPNEIIFTSGGTESDNTAIIQTALKRKNEGRHLITTMIEHEAVLKPMAYLEENGYEVTYLPVDENGVISLDDLKQALRPDTILVSVMTGNNEVGSHMPITEIGAIVAKSNAWFHTDAVQAYGILDIDVKRDQIDLMSTSAHKLNGPKQMGFLYERDGLDLAPHLMGGDQEMKRRAGTENIPAIAAFAKAVELEQNARAELTARYQGFKRQLVDKLAENGVDVKVNGKMGADELPQIINLWFEGCQNDAMLTNLDLAGIAAAAGSACTAGSLEPSHVLAAMYGKDQARVSQSLRFSFGKYNTAAEIDELVAQLTKISQRIKK
ncbi:cysteine desulfurase family protein [Ligilactobacillus animalis]|uniref:cysteine desulfurase family protein n=1 Tax=Ligilactobacillus animalis TaxID=1605 RepID=UPI000824E3EA|nr:cysteine desulfurase family protein [Ligilactobacillus animalis]MDO5883229.1 cysteine desulfurase family protein [Ligilactobacillus animalis]MDU3186495.1 cysteine desulfurase family protein [Ligilactobacillus animalis]MDU8986152.1 cysteine desulfurase family protein [Ligilactobacillus animalis]OCX48570.1 cysteine desulfurase NifS [Ligilactobacillus animalis]QHQ69833.1 aminotransferase class V-fold PLP-dependent enzyme [Ligilactobacillus animalis]